MKRFQTLVTGISAIALVAAFAAPTLAAKSVITDEELDEVTAAGQPKIAQAESDSGSATAVNFQVNIFAAHIDGQRELTALTLNNIFGENQIANGVNIQSGGGAAGTPAGGGNSGFQQNNVLQSWGSAKAWDEETISAIPGRDGRSIARCVGLIAKCHAGNGTNAVAGRIALLWAFADEIAEAEVDSGSAPASAANIVVTVIATALGADSQTDLTALTVNNVFGFNQVANGTNISSGSLTRGTDTTSGSIGAGGTVATNQANASSQFRGAPAGYNSAKTFF